MTARPFASRPFSEYLLAALSWLSFAVVFAVELGRYSPKRAWLTRFPVVLIFAGELSKLR
jgi:hypothetical protein